MAEIAALEERATGKKRSRTQARMAGPGVAAWLLMVLVSTLLTAAGKPVPVSPGDAGGALVDDACPTFSWGAASGATGHQLVVYRTDGGDGAPVLSRAFPASVGSWTPPLGSCLERGAAYGWSVRAVGTRASDWSAPLLFEVTPGPTVAEIADAVRLLQRWSASAAAGAEEEPRASRREDAGAIQSTRRAAARREPSTRGGAPETGLTVDGVVELEGIRGPDGGRYFVADGCEDNTHLFTIRLDGTMVCLPDSGDVAEVIAGAGLSGGGASGALTLAHEDTSAASSLDLTGGVVVQDVSVDGFGHVIAMGSASLDPRYINETGDTLGGDIDFLGDVGIGTTTPSRMLTVKMDNGNVVNSQMLVEQDGSGDAWMNFGLTGGRHYALGIDNSDGDRFKLGTESNSPGGVARNTLLEVDTSGNVEIAGELRRAPTATANLLPIAYGTIDEDGTILAGSGNFTVGHSAMGIYRIIISGHLFDLDAYVPFVTRQWPDDVLLSEIDEDLGDLVVTMRDTLLALLSDARFSFIVYRP